MILNMMINQIVVFQCRPAGAIYRKGLTQYKGNITNVLQNVDKQSKEFFMHLMVLNPLKRPTALDAGAHQFLRSRQ